MPKNTINNTRVQLKQFLVNNKLEGLDARKNKKIKSQDKFDNSKEMCSTFAYYLYDKIFNYICNIN